MLDTINYTKAGADLVKTVVNVTRVKDLDLEIEALTAQVADFKAGKTDQPEDQATIDAAIANYEAELLVLHAEKDAKDGAGDIIEGGGVITP